VIVIGNTRRVRKGIAIDLDSDFDLDFCFCFDYDFVSRVIDS
jgi:hypothetical protein